jgi:hypothetical protein
VPPPHIIDGPQPAQQPQLLVGDPATLFDCQAEMLELLGPIPEGQRVHGPPAADDVEHRHVLGQPDRVVERQNQDQVHRQPLRAGRDCRRQDHRRRQIAVFRPMVLAQYGGEAAVFFCPGAHFGHRGIQLGGGRAPRRGTHIEAQCEQRNS